MKVTVEGKEYKVWNDFIFRKTFAQDIAIGTVKTLKEGRYLTNELSLRKAIAANFGHETFKK